MPLKIDVGELEDWPDVHFLLVSNSPDSYWREQLDRLLTGWYDVGVHGGYGPADNPHMKGVLHNMSEPSFDDEVNGFRATWRADLGSAPRRALDVLIRALEGWSEYADLRDGTLTIR
jgi:hypothetical protein